jgi:hypothetical protein
MTERQYRLRSAGLLLARMATLFGGGLGVVLLLTVMTGEQRIACAFAVGALALPITMVAISTRSKGLDLYCLTGLALMSAIAFVELDAYLALLTMVLIGTALIGAVTVSSAVRPANRRLERGI